MFSHEAARVRVHRHLRGDDGPDGMMFSHEAVHGRAEAGGPDVRGDDGPAGMTFFYEAVHGRAEAGGPGVRGGDGLAGMTFCCEVARVRVHRLFEAAMAPTA